MDLVGAEESTNIRLQLCQFEVQIITFYVQNDFLFA